MIFVFWLLLLLRRVNRLVGWLVGGCIFVGFGCIYLVGIGVHGLLVCLLP